MIVPKRTRSAIRRYLAIALVMASIVAACGSSDDEESTGTSSVIEPGESPAESETASVDTASVETTEVSETGETAETGEETTATGESDPFTDAALDAELQEATAAIVDTLFECTTEPATDLTATARGVTAETISIAFLQNDWTTLESLNVAVDLGPEGEHFAALVDTINECGGIHGRTIEVNIYEFDPINFPQQDETCVKATVEDENLVVIARVLTREAPLCIVEQNESILISLGQHPNEFYDRSGGRLFGIDPTGDDLLNLIARDLVATGVLDEASIVGIISPDSPGETLAVRDGLVPALEELGIAYEEVVIPSSGLACEGYNGAVERFRQAEVTHVLPTLGPLCYPPFVAEATAVGWFPQYIATPFGGMTSDTSAQRMVDSGDAFDGAIGVHTLPGEAFLEQGPAPFEDACNAITNEALGYDNVYGDTFYGAITGLCTVAVTLQKGLEAAGPELTQESLIAGLETITDVPLRRGGLGSYSADDHNLVDNVVWGQTWRIDCACWTEPNGPREAN